MLTVVSEVIRDQTRLLPNPQQGEVVKLNERLAAARVEYERGLSKLRAAGGELEALQRRVAGTERAAKGECGTSQATCTAVVEVPALQYELRARGGRRCEAGAGSWVLLHGLRLRALS